MRNKTITILAVAAFLAASGPAWAGGQAAAVKPPGQAAVIGARAFLAYREITLYLRDGSVVFGRLLGADAGSVRVLRDGPDLDVPFRDIQKAVIKREGRPSAGILPGMIAGLHLGTGVLFGAFGNAGNYMPDLDLEDGYLGIAILYCGLLEAAFGAAGAGLGGLIAAAGRQRAFEFAGDPEDFGAARESFLRYLSGETPPARVHLLFQGGYVDPRVGRSLEGSLDFPGAVFRYFHREDSRFSLLRSLELSYSLKPRLRPGLRLSFTGEPGSYASFSNEAYNYVSVFQDYKATSLHAVCSYELLRAKRANGTSWSVGLGVGAASIRLSRASTNWNGAAYVEDRAEAKKTLASAVAFTSFRIRLTDVLSAGLAADYTYIPAVGLPALPNVGQPAMKIGLGNASVGFVIGYHF